VTDPDGNLLAFARPSASSQHGPILKISEDGYVTIFLKGRRVWEFSPGRTTPRNGFVRAESAASRLTG
jgi:hypothetical protein